jgi:hypothetical protein
MRYKNKTFLLLFFGVLLFAVGGFIHLSNDSRKTPASLEHSNSFNSRVEEENEAIISHLREEHERRRLMSAEESNELMKRQEEECSCPFKTFAEECGKP